MDGCERLVETLLDQATDAGGVPDLCGKDLCLQVVECVVIHAILDATLCNSRLCLDVRIFAIGEFAP
ncbi:MAG: hypothetical protein ABS40_10365 [Agrobacterium sp. SCN 61-19]|nr:MAG: hypothetical protein ABS40_10365 [Agrobacterium sp. SCN 61-19]